MALLDDIREIAEHKKKTKWQILLEHKEEIELMIKEDIPIKKQVELILKNQILDNLDYSEYRKILVKHFGYKGKYKKQKVFEITKKEEQTTKQQQQPQQQKKIEPKRPSRADPVEQLSQDVDIYQLGMKKRVEEMQQKGLL